MIRRLVRAIRRLVAPRSHGLARSNHWRTVANHFLVAHGSCAACGAKKRLQVHHVDPFHRAPEKELDPRNLIALCKPHHLCFGHLDCWRRANPHCREDAATHRQRVEAAATI